MEQLSARLLLTAGILLLIAGGIFAILKVGRKEKDFVLYRPSLGGCVWMPDGSFELSGFQK